jgi:hypothetical protein
LGDTSKSSKGLLNERPFLLRALFRPLHFPQSVILGLDPRTHAKDKPSLEIFEGVEHTQQWILASRARMTKAAL